MRHLLRALGVQGRIKSPTYAVVEPHATPDGLEVRFLAYPPPAAGERLGVEVYKPGAPLFTLSRLQDRVLTRWTGFVPDEGVVRSPAPYFRKER